MVYQQPPNEIDRKGRETLQWQENAGGRPTGVDSGDRSCIGLFADACSIGLACRISLFGFRRSDNAAAFCEPPFFVKVGGAEGGLGLQREGGAVAVDTAVGFDAQPYACACISMSQPEAPSFER